MNVVSGKSVESIALGGPFFSPGAGRCSSSTTSRRKYLCIECNSIYNPNNKWHFHSLWKQSGLGVVNHNEQGQLTFPAGLSLLLVIFIFRNETPCLIQKAPELGASGWTYSPERGWGSAVPTGSHLWRKGEKDWPSVCSTERGTCACKLNVLR